VGEVLHRDRQALERSEANAVAQLAWLREESRAVWRLIFASEGKLGALVQRTSVSLLRSEQDKIASLRAKVASLEAARRDLVRHMGAPALATEIEFFEGEIGAVEQRVVSAQDVLASQVERRELRLAVASEDLILALQERLTELHAEIAACHTAHAESPEARGRAEKRGAGDLSPAVADVEPEAKRAKTEE
jgi:hypothetical protein